MAKPILVANWKNHPSSLKEAKTLLAKISKSSRLYKKLHFFVAPPTTYFETVSSRPKSLLNLASQNVFVDLKGSHTGEIGLDILKSFGVRAVIVGHSERRALGETSKDVSLKVKTVLKSGITPIVCIGELTKDLDGGHFEFLRDEIRESLDGIKRSDVSKLVLAYEPVWAIGKSATDSISQDDLVQTVIFIKKVLTDLFGRILAEKVPILYGGSTEPANAETLFSNTGIRGFLVGHASLDAEDLKKIASAML